MTIAGPSLLTGAPSPAGQSVSAADVESMVQASIGLIIKTIYENPYIPWKPYPKQALFCALPHKEVLFGGAVGGSKSVALLMAAAQYVTEPGYRALILRRTTKQLRKGEGILSISKEWFGRRGADGKPLAHWNGTDLVWTFPSGATIEFGHVQHVANKEDYQGGGFHFIGFDELTQFVFPIYSYLLTRLRKRADTWWPTRVRATSNPGSIGHDFVKKLFIPNDYVSARESTAPMYLKGSRVFIPSLAVENPGLDVEDYRQSMIDSVEQDELTRLWDGDWRDFDGGIFASSDFKYYMRSSDSIQANYYLLNKDGSIAEILGPEKVLAHYAMCDPAGSSQEAKAEEQHAKKSYCVLQEWVILETLSGPKRLLIDQWREQCKSDRLHAEIMDWWLRRDLQFIGIEDHGLGIPVASRAKEVGVNVRPMKPMGQDKLTRAYGYRIRVRSGSIYLPRGDFAWVDDFVSEHSVWKGLDTQTADQIDAAVYADKIADEIAKDRIINVGGTPSEVGPRKSLGAVNSSTPTSLSLPGSGRKFGTGVNLGMRSPRRRLS